MRKSFQNRNGWILFGVTLAFLMTFGWTVLAQAIEHFNHDDTFRVEVTDVKLVSQSGDVNLLKDPFYALDSIVFDVSFLQPGDYVEYEAVLSNLGSTHAYLDDITVQFQDSVINPIRVSITGVKTGSTKLYRFDTNRVFIRFTYEGDASVDDTSFVPQMTSLLRFFYRSL